MAFVQADLDAIDDAIVSIAASGAEEVAFSDGRRVRYTSLDSLLKARAAIATLVGQSESAGSRIKQVRLVSGGGW